MQSLAEGYVTNMFSARLIHFSNGTHSLIILVQDQQLPDGHDAAEDLRRHIYHMVGATRVIEQNARTGDITGVSVKPRSHQIWDAYMSSGSTAENYLHD